MAGQRPLAPAASAERILPQLGPHLPGLTLAVITLAAAVVLGAVAGAALVDPDASLPFYRARPFILGASVVVFVPVDICVRGLVRAGFRAPAIGPAMRLIARERWSLWRLGQVVAGLVSFYVTYFAYRDLKSFVPLVRPLGLDRALLAFDHDLLFGHDPATALQGLLGTGAAAHVLSAVYLAFVPFGPISIVAVLVFAKRVRTGAWYVTAVNINWLLGLVGYYLVPALGPYYSRASIGAGLPFTGVTHLQETLLHDRVQFLLDPTSGGVMQSIAAFPSLHVSVVFTAALIAQRSRLWRPAKIAMWVYLALTAVATIYFGWHYIPDDIAGLAIGAAAVYLADRMTRRPVDRAAETSAAAPSEVKA